MSTHCLLTSNIHCKTRKNFPLRKRMFHLMKTLFSCRTLGQNMYSDNSQWICYNLTTMQVLAGILLYKLTIKQVNKKFEENLKCSFKTSFIPGHSSPLSHTPLCEYQDLNSIHATAEPPKKGGELWARLYDKFSLTKGTSFVSVCNHDFRPPKYRKTVNTLTRTLYSKLCWFQKWHVL